MRTRARAVALRAVVAGVLAVVAGALAPAALATTPSADVAPTPLVVVGAPGLAWSDLDRDDLPALRSLVEDGALGSLTVRAVRSRSCAVDGWLTVSAGRRAADLPGPCRVPGPVVDGAVPGWSALVTAAAGDGYGARPGTLGSAVLASGSCVETVGAGAAIGGADAGGRVATHLDAVPAAFGCPVALVDAGVLPPEGQARADAVARLDEVVAAVLRAVPDGGADVVVAGVGDGDSSVRPRAVLASGPSFGTGELTSASTRQPGLAQLQDLTATLLSRVGADTSPVTGRPLQVVDRDGPVVDRVADRVGFEVRAATLRSVSPQVTGWLAAAYALWCAAVALLWWRTRHRPADDLPTAVRFIGVAVATVPISTFVANLVPWWHASAPGAAFAAVLAVVVAGHTGAALAAGRRRPLGALLLVAVSTVYLLGSDVLRGSGLQLGSVFGQNPTVGGRFYGFGNTSFALYGLAVLVLVAALARTTNLSRRWGAGLALALLVVALAVEALPSLGADFGGPPALLLGGLLVVAASAGLRLTPVRVVGALVGAGVLVVGVAVLDWLRPADSRTHLGEFVESVVSGEAAEVVGRKVAQNVANLGSPPLVAITLATVLLVVVGWRTGHRPGRAASVVLRGATVLAVVGFAVNDSGLVIPAFVAVVLAPLLVAERRRDEERG